MGVFELGMIRMMKMIKNEWFFLTSRFRSLAKFTLEDEPKAGEEPTFMGVKIATYTQRSHTLGPFLKLRIRVGYLLHTGGVVVWKDVVGMKPKTFYALWCPGHGYILSLNPHSCSRCDGTDLQSDKRVGAPFLLLGKRDRIETAWEKE